MTRNEFANLKIGDVVHMNALNRNQNIDLGKACVVMDIIHDRQILVRPADGVVFEGIHKDSSEWMANYRMFTLGEPKGLKVVATFWLKNGTVISRSFKSSDVLEEINKDVDLLKKDIMECLHGTFEHLIVKWCGVMVRIDDCSAVEFEVVKDK